jgi:Na+/H+ antiporter NhaD/arsenite permease-like protein
VAGPIGSLGPGALARVGAAVTMLSQAVSNVPAVLLFVPAMETLAGEVAERGWLALAAFSTLAGNLTIIGSVANVIVFEGARREGIEVGFGAYLKAGLPITAVTLVIAWTWLAFT